MFPIETISAKMLDYYVGRRDSLLIDLRSPDRFAAGHVKGAVNLPYEQLQEPGAFPEDKVLIFYCERGSASLDAARRMAKYGYQTRSVIGGFLAYKGRYLVK